MVHIETLYSQVWEFIVRPGCESQFERIYGPDGDWPRLFSQDASYRGTELHTDTQRAGRYLTVDYWVTPTAYQEFCKRHAESFNALDRKCEELTQQETPMGSYLCIRRTPRATTS